MSENNTTTETTDKPDKPEQPEKKAGGVAAKAAAAAAKKREAAGGGGGADDEPKDEKKEVEKAEEPKLDPQLRSDVRSENASGSASNGASSPLGGVDSGNISLAALMGGGIDPERDMVNPGARIPRYVKAAMETVAMLTKNSRTPVDQQTIVTEALKAYLPQEILETAYNNATRGFGNR